MNDDVQPIQSVEFAAPPSNAGTTRTGLVVRLHRHMRGYYTRGVLMGLLLLPLGAFYGYRSAAPVYRSMATLRITPLTLRILYAQADVAPSIFDGFVDVQVSIMRSRSLVESLMRNSEWIEARESQNPLDPEVFLRNLEIVHPTRSEIVNISYTDGTPQTAMLGTRLLIDEYLKLHGDRKGNQRLAATEERSEALAKKLVELRERMNEIASEHGTDDLKQLHQAKMQELARLETMLKDTEINLLLAEAALGNADAFKTMPASEIATHDETLRKLVDEANRVEVQLNEIQDAVGEEHPTLVSLKTKQKQLQSQIADRAEAFRKFRRTSFVNNIGVLEGVPTPAGVDALRVRRDKLKKLYDESLTKAMEVGRKALQVANLNEDFRLNKERLSENQTKLEQLRVDSAVIGQINVINEADLPAHPLKDRRKTLALGGGLVSFAAGFALVVLWRLTDRRLRTVSDLQCLSLDIPVLARFPDVSPQLSQKREANACMREMLTTLKIDPQMRNARVIVVTSPREGTGSSEIASALALALAESGKKTLLVDFDLNRASLSRDWIACVGLLDKANAMSINDFLLGDGLDPQRVRTGVDRLYFLHQVPDARRPVMHRESIAKLFSEACQAFEMVIVDTASPVDCLETLLVCQAAETVLLCIDPTTTDPEVLDCYQRMKTAEASLGGIVFNRAPAGDLKLGFAPPMTEGTSIPYLSPPGKLIQAIRAAGAPVESCSTVTS